MKQLTDDDILEMTASEFIPDDVTTRRAVRTDLHLSTRIPPTPAPLPHIAHLDLHRHTEEQAWEKIMTLATSGIRDAVIITGASGILKIKFQQWTQESILSPYIIEWHPLNNGSFAVKFRRNAQNA